MGHSLPVAASFWYGSDLSWLEAVCIKSYLDRGHRFVLYTAEEISGVPDGAEIRPASEIFWPPPFPISDNDRLRVAVFSDIFRLHLVSRTGFIWVDLDAYCVHPFDFATPYVFGRSHRGTFPSGVMGLPQDSRTLAAMLEFVTSPNPSQPWRGTRMQRVNKRRVDRGETWGIESLPWGCSGPKAFGHFLAQTGEDRHAMQPDTFYPLAPEDLWKLHTSRVATAEIEREGVFSVHIFGHQKKKLAIEFFGLPAAGSYLDRLCSRHEIDPKEQGVLRLGWMR
ncbi:hypothetical protein [Ruegeria sp. HKCCD8929]|uniref:hypothetical protein n=1 Tax=Ruegeria sp. HKCCD8929 TaxID=2683006 RepID=UPI001487EFA6|nr:hypothetical protein [Ruegeria sp. HKCCD8929]